MSAKQTRATMSAHLSKVMIAKVRRLAKEQRRPLSWVVEDLLEAGLRVHASKPSEASAA